MMMQTSAPGIEIRAYSTAGDLSQTSETDGVEDRSTTLGPTDKTHRRTRRDPSPSPSDFHFCPDPDHRDAQVSTTKPLNQPTANKRLCWADSDIEGNEEDSFFTSVDYLAWPWLLPPSDETASTIAGLIRNTTATTTPTLPQGPP